MELGERIATLREEQALTQTELAEAARISPSTLSQIESGRVPRPHVGTVRKIARALGIEPAELRRTEELAFPKAKAPEAGRLTIIDVAWDAARRQIARNRQADPRGIADDGPSNEASHRLREEYGLGGNDAEELVDFALKYEHLEEENATLRDRLQDLEEENATLRDRLQEHKQAHS